MSDDLDDMCPNCVTPWKCNGPHVFSQPADIDFDDDGELIPVRFVPAPPDDSDW